MEKKKYIVTEKVFCEIAKDAATRNLMSFGTSEHDECRKAVDAHCARTTNCNAREQRCPLKNVVLGNVRSTLHGEFDDLEMAQGEMAIELLR